MEEESSSSGSETQPTTEDADSMQSERPDPVDPKVSGESPSREGFHPRSVVAAHQEPNDGLTGDAKPEDTSSVFHNLTENPPSEEEPPQETATNGTSGDGTNVAPVIPPRQEAEVVGDGMKTWLARVGVKARREVRARAHEEVDAAAGQEELSLKNDEPLTVDASHDGAVIRSKVQFTKTADGTQTLSYEEEMVKPEDERATPHCGKKTHQKLGRRRKLRSTFLNFLR